MGFKTLTIKDEAYARLRALKGPGESYSQLLIRLSKRPSLGSFFGILKGGAKKAKEAERITMGIRRELSASLKLREKRLGF